MKPEYFSVRKDSLEILRLYKETLEAMRYLETLDLEKLSRAEKIMGIRFRMERDSSYRQTAEEMSILEKSEVTPEEVKEIDGLARGSTDQPTTVEGKFQYAKQILDKATYQIGEKIYDIANAKNRGKLEDILGGIVTEIHDSFCESSWGDAIRVWAEIAKTLR